MNIQSQRSGWRQPKLNCPEDQQSGPQDFAISLAGVHFQSYCVFFLNICSPTCCSLHFLQCSHLSANMYVLRFAVTMQLIPTPSYNSSCYFSHIIVLSSPVLMMSCKITVINHHQHLVLTMALKEIFNKTGLKMGHQVIRGITFLEISNSLCSIIHYHLPLSSSYPLQKFLCQPHIIKFN